MLERVIEGVRQAKLVDEVVVAAPHPIECSCPVFIGSETDVVNRYYKCSEAHNADVVVRITSDCPMISPEVIDMAISYFHAHDYPYVYFAPIDGLDVEVFYSWFLEEANRKALPDEREHVTTYMKRKTKISVDTEHDLEKIRSLWTGQIK